MSRKTQLGRSVLDLIGNTPILELGLKNAPGRIFLKLEKHNPGGNVKDRSALNMVIAAEQRGDLRKGGTIIESSSGNTGLALAMIGAARGYRVIVVVDNHVQAEKIAVIRAYGAQIEHVGRHLPPEQQAGEERDLRIRELLAAIPGAFCVGQGDNLDNQEAHYRTTAEEILATVGAVDYFFAAIGTGGTISGTARRLKEAHPATRVIGLEPKGSVFFGDVYEPFYLSGAGSTKEIWRNIDFSLIDEHFQVSDQQAFNTARFLARHYGLLTGGTGGLVAYMMLAYLASKQCSGTVVGLLPDGGEQYLNTLFNDEWMAEHRLFDPNLDRFLKEHLLPPFG